MVIMKKTELAKKIVLPTLVPDILLLAVRPMQYAQLALSRQQLAAVGLQCIKKPVVNLDIKSVTAPVFLPLNVVVVALVDINAKMEAV